MDKGKVICYTQRAIVSLCDSRPTKVTAKVNLTNVITLQSRPPSRPHSPSKPKPPPPPSSMLSEPTFRPKAKVSSSAAIVVGRSSSSSSTGNSTAKSMTRPPSPFKPPHGHARKLSTTRSAVDVHVSRPKASLMPHELSRQRSLTSTLEASSLGARRSSGSFHPTPSTPASPRLSPDNPPPNQTVRVKAKVSSLAKTNGVSTSPTPASSLNPSSPPLSTTCPTESRPGAPSITDVSRFGSRPPSPTVSTVPITIHPITTPTPAANPHRYTPRISPHIASTRFHPRSPPTSREPNNGVPIRIPSKVDPAAIPLPPQSPPSSTLSFSSQSSKNTQDSSGSGSTAPSPYSHAHSTTGERGGSALGPGPTFDVFDDLSDPNSPRYSLGSPTTYADQLKNSDRKTRAEAKTNRKVTNYPPICVYLSLTRLR